MTPEQIQAEAANIFNSEKWNKFQLSEYSLSKFQKIEELVNEALAAGMAEQLVPEAEETLKKNEYNLSLMFMLGLFDYRTDRVVPATVLFQKLVMNFRKKDKNSIVEYLCRKMLDFGDDVFALKNLIAVLKAGGPVPELEQLQERLIGIDSSDNETLLSLAYLKEKSGHTREAQHYFLQALGNFIREQSRKNVEEIWNKIIAIVPNYSDLLLPLEEHLLAAFDREFVLHLLQLLAPGLSAAGSWDDLISIYKKILAYNSTDRELRNKLIELYSKKYETHTQLAPFIIYSGLKQWWEDIFQAIAKFEKYIQYDVGRYVYHHGFGVGQIRQIQETDIYIDFDNDTNHKMTFDMAISSLTVLPPDHIRIYKRFRREELTAFLKDSPLKVVEIILKQAPEMTVNVEGVKAELVEDLIPAADWNRWWNRARSDLKQDDHFVVTDNKVLHFIDKPVSFTDQVRQRYQDAGTVGTKAAVVSELLASDKRGSVDDSFFKELSGHFKSLLGSTDHKAAMTAYLVLLRLGKEKKKLDTGISHFDFKQKMPKDKDLIDFFNSLEDNENRKLFTGLIEEKVSSWEEILLKLLYARYSLIHQSLLDKIEQKLGVDRARTYVEDLVEHYREYPDLFFWVGRNIVSSNPVFVKYKIDHYTIYINMLYLISLLGRKIRSSENPEENTRLQKNIISLLFANKDGHLIDYVVEQKKSGNPKADTLIEVITENTYVPDKYKKTLMEGVRNLEKMIIT